MAKATPVLWTHKTNKAGHHPIYIRLADRYRTLYCSTGEYIAARHWNPNALRVRKGHPNADDLNALIVDLLAAVQAERVRLKRAQEPITAGALQAAARAFMAGSERGAADFLAYADRHADAYGRRGQVRECRRQRAVFKKLRAFAGGGPLPFDRVTAAFLGEYETHLFELGNKPSTANANFRVIRTAFRAAIRDGEVDEARDPFKRYRLPKVQPADRPKLTAEQVRALEEVDLGGRGPGAPLAAQVRDYFLFALYTAGVRFTDVAVMRRSNVRVGSDNEGAKQVVVSYRMGKNKELATVRMDPAGHAIVDAYLAREAPGGDPFLFPMMEGYDLSTPAALVNASGSQNAVVNKYLKKVAAAVVDQFGIDMPALTFHLARHTWAELARQSGRDVYEISKGMVHSKLAVTEHYLARGGGDVIDAAIKL